MQAFLGLILVALILAGCATPTVVQTRQAGDATMNCQQIRAAHQEAVEFEQRARREKGVTGTNVAAALFFWPAMIATYKNAEEAIDAARDRQRYLERLAQEKNCRIF